MTVSHVENDPNVAAAIILGCAANTTATLSDMDVRALGNETVKLTGTPTEGGIVGWLEPNSNPD